MLPSENITYTDLYARWEEGSWSAMKIDLSQDQRQWRQLSDLKKQSAIWMYSMFFNGENSVADNLSPYIEAAPTAEQKYFLATQQVDEARHAIFFHRFFEEVIGAGDNVQGTLAYAQDHLNWAYSKVFNRLDKMAEQLSKDKSLPQYAQAIALYHMIVEGALAQPGQHFIEDYYVEGFPGLKKGISNIAHDEQRHIGFGVKVLSELFQISNECRQAVEETLTEMFPYTAAVFTPPEMNEGYVKAYDFELEDIYAFAFRLVETRWKTTGYPLDEMPTGVYPLDTNLSYRQRAAEHVNLLRAGFFRSPGSPIVFNQQAEKYYFQLFANSVQLEHIPSKGLKIQFVFNDANNFFIDLHPHQTPVSGLGEINCPDLVFLTDWKSWVKMSQGLSPLKLLAQRKLKIQGWKALPRIGRALPASRSQLSLR